jgi:hypothetical protein
MMRNRLTCAKNQVGEETKRSTLKVRVYRSPFTARNGGTAPSVRFALQVAVGASDFVGATFTLRRANSMRSCFLVIININAPVRSVFTSLGGASHDRA